MATCPRCKGPLTDGHRCPRRTSLVALEIVVWAIGGALAGWLLLFLFDPNGQVGGDFVTIVVGAVAGIVVNRFVRS